MLLFERTAVIYCEPIPTGWGSKTAAEMGRGSSPHPVVADSLQVCWREWGETSGGPQSQGAGLSPFPIWGRLMTQMEESVTEEGTPSMVGAADTQNPGNKITRKKVRISMMVRRLRLHASIAQCMGGIPGRGTKILHAVWHSQKLLLLFKNKC